MSRSILLVDDDPEVLALLGRFFEHRGWIVSRAAAGGAGVEAFERDEPDLVLLDLALPDVSGLSVLATIRERDADATVLLLTGNADVATAVDAMRLGAENFLVKPPDFDHLEAAVERAYEKVELRRRERFFAERETESAETMALGRSPQMREAARQVELLAASDTTVLLTGETGTGKGWVARLLHSLSARSSGPFIEINCAGLSATFLDSELFGHEKGAFTDAKTLKHGLFEIAHGGTLFLDEIGDLALDLQPKLLKAIESHRFRRLGGTREIEVNVRVIAATHRDLEAAVRAGGFREDLYYRLAVLPLKLPPLRERGRDDVVDLATRLLIDLRRRIGRGPSRISPDALERLVRYPWPGNIRELHNVLERVLLLSGSAVEVRPEHLPSELHEARLAAPAAGDPELSLAEMERRHIARVLEHCGGNRSRAARVLGISRAALYEKIRRFGLGGPPDQLKVVR